MPQNNEHCTKFVLQNTSFSNRTSDKDELVAKNKIKLHAIDFNSQLLLQ